jgi:murein DD-endopeptidase MepM/ murein hydrolase activator NlpD
MKHFLSIKKIIVVVFVGVFVVSPIFTYVILGYSRGSKFELSDRSHKYFSTEKSSGHDSLAFARSVLAIVSHTISPASAGMTVERILLKSTVLAETVDELNKKISDQKGMLEQLDAEIKKINSDLQTTGVEKSTLQATLKNLEASRKKLEKDISYTQGNISLTNLNINKLSLSIEDKNKKIEEGRLAMGKTIRALSEIDSTSPLEVFLSNESMGDVWNYAQALVTVNHEVQGNVRELQGLARDLAIDKQETEAKKKELEKQKRLLGAQKQSVLTTSQEKTQVLKETQNKEANYQKQLVDKKAQKEAFEKALFDFEQQLKIKVDPSSYASAKAGIFNWPLANPKITQLFGLTADSKRLYTSGTHNGVDFGTPTGTPVKAVLAGTVTATGNTDLQAGCYSYGKWVLLKHSNGLSTLYGHFSAISVAQGASVNTGDVIGLSGNTGYSTGPHLHLTVFATQGMRVQTYTSSIGCKQVTIPIADKSAYLDPMVYLPH